MAASNFLFSFFILCASRSLKLYRSFSYVFRLFDLFELVLHHLTILHLPPASLPLFDSLRHLRLDLCRVRTLTVVGAVCNLLV